MASGKITVANLVPGTNVKYYVAGAGSGAEGFGSGTLGNPTSGVYKETVAVDGYELYAVTFYPVGAPEKSGEVVVDQVAVEGSDPIQVSLAISVT